MSDEQAVALAGACRETDPDRVELDFRDADGTILVDMYVNRREKGANSLDRLVRMVELTPDGHVREDA